MEFFVFLLFTFLFMGSTSSTTAPVKMSTTSSSNENRASFGAGCYWGTEKYFKKSFPEKTGKPPISNGQVGFMGPPTSPANPTYKQVCSGSTGHVEVYDFEYTGGADTYEALVKFFFQFHDPTTFNAQGGDTGTQYASVIYTYTPEQFEIASRVKSELQSHLDRGFTTSYANKQISTDVRTATTFFPAHGEHQAYLDKNPDGYCNHRIRFKEWPAA